MEAKDLTIQALEKRVEALSRFEKFENIGDVNKYIAGLEKRVEETVQINAELCHNNTELKFRLEEADDLISQIIKLDYG